MGPPELACRSLRHCTRAQEPFEPGTPMRVVVFNHGAPMFFTASAIACGPVSAVPGLSGPIAQSIPSAQIFLAAVFQGFANVEGLGQYKFNIQTSGVSGQMVSISMYRVAE